MTVPFLEYKEVRKIQTILISIIASTITAKVIATYYFKKIDGYIEKMCEMTMESNRQTIAILHKLQKNSGPEV